MSLVLYIFLYTLCACSAIAKPINVTVDDRYGAWPAFGISQSINYGEGWFDSGFDKCNRCRDMTAFQAAINGTWKRATYEQDKPQDEPKIATFTFNGTAVYVNIFRGPTSAGGVKGNMDLLFTLDGIASRIEDDAKPFVFTQTVFAQPSLPQGQHTLTIQNGDPNGKHSECVVFLDSIIYTTDASSLAIPVTTASESSYPLDGLGHHHVPTETPSLSASPVSGNTHRVAGNTHRLVLIVAGVGGAIAVSLLAVLSFLIVRQIKRRRSSRDSLIEPLASSSTLRRDSLVPRPFLKALPTVTSSAWANDQTSFGLGPIAQSLQSRSTVRTLGSTRPPTYRTRDSLATQASRRL